MSTEPTTEENPVFSMDMLRVIADERERDFQAELQRRLLAERSSRIRWHHRPARPRPKAR